MNVNDYGRQLSPAEIETKEHRNLVGGLWEELGTLQFNFLKDHGLQPHHRLVDLGCGALRGGLHFIRYLDAGHYYGIDINASLIEAGKRELDQEQLGARAHSCSSTTGLSSAASQQPSTVRSPYRSLRTCR